MTHLFKAYKVDNTWKPPKNDPNSFKLLVETYCDTTIDVDSNLRHISYTETPPYPGEYSMGMERATCERCLSTYSLGLLKDLK